MYLIIIDMSTFLVSSRWQTDEVDADAKIVVVPLVTCHMGGQMGNGWQNQSCVVLTLCWPKKQKNDDYVIFKVYTLI